ncbi:ATPase [Cycloclasticus sp. 46_120_T64]|mgnify:CR=1 FL=1|nr:ATPase [Cycloclasticus sp. 46_120_T64]
MVSPTIKKRTYLLPAAALLSLLFSLYLMSHATQSSSQFNSLFSTLLLINIIGSLILFGLLVSNTLRLWRQFKNKTIGSRITAKVVLLFFAISVIPTGIVFYFSNQLLHQSIDSWFDAKIDNAVQDSLSLSRRSLDNRTLSLMKETRQLANQLENESDMLLSLTLASLREESNANELSVFSKQGQIIATTNLDPGVLLPNAPDPEMLLLAKQNGEFVSLEPSPHDGLIVRTLIEIKHSSPKRYLQAIYTVPEDLSELASSVENAYTAYQEFNYLRGSLKFSFTLTLSMVLMFSLLAASWASFVFARELIEPIRQLVRGTQDVAAGNYEKKLTVERQDELGFLVNSFNDMTVRIASARQQATTAQREAEAQHAYLKTILSHLSNGVLGFDLSLRLKMVNHGAGQILDCPLSACIEYSLTDIAVKFPELQGFSELLIDKFSSSKAQWHHEHAFTIKQQNKTLLLKGAPLYAADQRITGYVLVFDDMTPIIQSQRNAAWSEVAQRLAHEIKNPLTPIQLSAERLQRKLQGKLDPADDKLLAKSTNTIIHQVSAMKSMVDDFSDFARPPKSNPQSIHIDQLIDDISGLYRGQIKQLKLHIDPAIPAIFADPIRLRQVLINLIKNAQEAINDMQNGQVDISVSHLNELQSVQICIADNGLGVDNSMLTQIFEPYTTSKDKGTGLGLAIVKKIIEEHGGSISLKPIQPQGANFIIQLPVMTDKSNRSTEILA